MLKLKFRWGGAMLLLTCVLVFAGCSGGSDGGGTNQGPGDTDPPSLVSITPDNGTDRVPTNAAVVATFSEEIDPASINSTNFFVLGVTGTVSVNGAAATFTPDDYLAPTTSYSAQLGAGVEDLTGNPTNSGAQAQFTTAALPTATAGGDVVASMGQPFQLDGSASLLAPRVPGLDYEWIQIGGTDVGGPYSGERPTITAPDQIGTLVFELSVIESGTKSLIDEVSVVVVEDATNALFVDATAGAGNGSLATPYGTLADALAATRAASPRPSIYVAAGIYTVSIDLDAETHIYGGFEPGSWKRDVAQNITRVEGGSTAVSMDGASGSVLDGLTIMAAAASSSGQSSIGVHLRNSSDVIVRDCVIEAGDGATGGNGSRPGAPTKQSKGGKGDDHGGCIPANAGGGGGGGGNSAAQGGAGGNGGLFGGKNGGGGEDANGDGGGGGNGGATYKDGKSGTAGDPGGRGGDGSRGAEFGGIGVAGFYEGAMARGGTGGAGGRGGGGGGGG
ncbi:hypothetical protein DRQ53_13930, partial [bacterium]